jgi:Spy/CpxP family protein refolding chaperone
MMKRSIWISTLLVAVLAFAGAAAAGDHPQCASDAPRDAAGLSGPRSDGGGCGPAGAAPRCGNAASGCRGAAQGATMCGAHAGQRDGGKCCDMGGCGHGPQAAMGRGMGGGMMGHGMMGHGMAQGMGPGMGPGAGRDGPGAAAPHGDMGSGPGDGPDDGLGMGQGIAMLHQLDLTPAQREKFADIHERAMKQNIQAGADLQIARLDLAKLMRAETPDGRAIDAQIDKLAGLRAGIQKSRVAALLEARALLTPEQQKKLRELRAGMHPGMGPGAGGQRMMGGRGGHRSHGGRGGWGMPDNQPAPPGGDDD